MMTAYAVRKKEYMIKNKDIRIKAIERGVYFWQVASKLGISPESMSRMLRRELEGEKKEKEKVMQAIDAAAKELAGQPAGTEGGGVQ